MVLRQIVDGTVIKRLEFLDCDGLLLIYHDLITIRVGLVLVLLAIL